MSIEDSVDGADEVNIPNNITVCIYAYPTLADASTCVSNNNFLTLPGHLTPVSEVEVGSKEVRQRGVYRLTCTLDFTDTASAPWFKEDNGLYLRIFISYSGYDYVTHQNYDPSNLFLTHSTSIDYISPAVLLEPPLVLTSDITLDVTSPVPSPPSQAVTVVVRGLPDLSELSEDEYKLQVIYHPYITKEAASIEIICDVVRECVVYMERGLAEVHLTPPISAAFLNPAPQPTSITTATKAAESEAIVVGTVGVVEVSDQDPPQAVQVFIELRVIQCKLIPDAIIPLDDTAAVIDDTTALQRSEDAISDQLTVEASTDPLAEPTQDTTVAEVDLENPAALDDGVDSDLVKKPVAIRAPEYEILQVIPLHNNAYPFILYKTHTLSLSPLVARVTGGSVIILTGLRYLPPTMTLAILSTEDGRVLQTCEEWQDEDEYQRLLVLEEEVVEEARRALADLNLAPDDEHTHEDDMAEDVALIEPDTSDEIVAEIAPEVSLSNDPVDTAVHSEESQDAVTEVTILYTIQQPLQDSPTAATTTTSSDYNTRQFIDFTNEYKIRITIPSLLPLYNTTSDEPHPHSDPDSDAALSTLLEHGVYIAPLMDSAGATWPHDLCPKLVLFNEISVAGPLTKGKGGVYTATVTGLNLPSTIDTLPCFIRVCIHPPSSFSAITSEVAIASDASLHSPTNVTEAPHTVPDQGYSIFKHIDVDGTLTKHTEKSGVSIKLSFTPPSSDACAALFALSHSQSTASAIGSQQPQGAAGTVGTAGIPAVGAVGAAKSPRKSMIDKNKPGATSSSNIHMYYIGISVDGGCSYDYSKEPVLELK